MNDSPLDIVGSTSRALCALGHRILQLNPWVISVILVALMLIKDGVGFYYVFEPQEISSAFPLPLAGPDASSFGWPLIVWALQLETYRGLWLIPLASMLVACITLTPVLAAKLGRPVAYTASAVTLLGPIPLAGFSHLGRHDFLILIGGCSLAISLRKPIIAVLSALLMSLGNPEQALLATSLLLAILVLLGQRSALRGGIAAISAAVIFWVASSIWLSSLGVPSRIQYLRDVMAEFAPIALRNLPTLAWATYGLVLLAIVMLVVASSGLRRWLLLVAVLLPLGLFFIGDQSRIAVAVSTPVAIYSTILVLRRIFKYQDAAKAPEMTAGVIAVAVIAPSIHILFLGGYFEPYASLIDLLGP